MRRRRLIFLSGLIAAMVLLATARPVNAFYWYGWPGSKQPPDRTIIPPPGVDTPGNPPDTPPDTPPDIPPPDTPPTTTTPEPATALAALIGLGTLAARRTWQRKK